MYDELKVWSGEERSVVYGEIEQPATLNIPSINRVVTPSVSPEKAKEVLQDFDDDVYVVTTTKQLKHKVPTEFRAINKHGDIIAGWARCSWSSVLGCLVRFRDGKMILVGWLE